MLPASFWTTKTLSLAFNPSVFTKLKNLPRDNRRYDFYTIEELLNIIRVLSKLKINLVENIDWKTCTENLVISKYLSKQHRTSISLTFIKE